MFINFAIQLPNAVPTKNVGLPLPPWKPDPKATAVNIILQIESIMLTGLLNESFINDWPKPLSLSPKIKNKIIVITPRKIALTYGFLVNIL